MLDKRASYGVKLLECRELQLIIQLSDLLKCKVNKGIIDTNGGLEISLFTLIYMNQNH